MTERLVQRGLLKRMSVKNKEGFRGGVYYLDYTDGLRASVKITEVSKLYPRGFTIHLLLGQSY